MSAAARRAIVEARGEPGRWPSRAGAAAGRPARPYTSLADFVGRTRVSREIAENLVRLGAFDALGVRREELVAQVPLLYAGARAARRPGRRLARPPADSGLDQPRLALDEQFGPLAFLPDWSRAAAREHRARAARPQRQRPPAALRARRGRGARGHAHGAAARGASRPPRARGRRARARPDALDPQRPPHHVPHARGRDRAGPGGGLQRRLPQVRAGAQETPSTCSSRASCRTTRSTASRWWRTASWTY